MKFNSDFSATSRITGTLVIAKLLPWCILISVLLVPLAWSQERAIRPATSKASTGAIQVPVISNSE